MISFRRARITGLTLAELCERLSPDVRKRALTHPSTIDDRSESYERYEYLGDAVLGLAIAAELVDRSSVANEGELSKLKAAVVSRRDCALVAKANNLGKLMVESCAGAPNPHELRRLAQRDSVLAALTESVIGAGFLEFGFEKMRSVVVANFEERISQARDNRADYKSELQELAQRVGTSVEYQVVSTTGPDHDRVFTVEANVHAEGLSAKGEGRSKKAAEQQAAGRVLEAFRARDAAAVTNGAGDTDDTAAELVGDDAD